MSKWPNNKQYIGLSLVYKNGDLSTTENEFVFFFECSTYVSYSLVTPPVSLSVFPPGHLSFTTLPNNQHHGNSEPSPSNDEKQPGPDDWLGQIEEREWDRKWERRTERMSYQQTRSTFLKTALLSPSAEVLWNMHFAWMWKHFIILFWIFNNTKVWWGW